MDKCEKGCIVSINVLLRPTARSLVIALWSHQHGCALDAWSTEVSVVSKVYVHVSLRLPFVKTWSYGVADNKPLTARKLEALVTAPVSKCGAIIENVDARFLKLCTQVVIWTCRMLMTITCILQWNKEVQYQFHKLHVCTLTTLFVEQGRAVYQERQGKPVSFTLPDHSRIKLYVKIQVDWSGGPLNRLQCGIRNWSIEWLHPLLSTVVIRTHGTFLFSYFFSLRRLTATHLKTWLQPATRSSLSFLNYQVRLSCHFMVLLERWVVTEDDSQRFCKPYCHGNVAHLKLGRLRQRKAEHWRRLVYRFRGRFCQHFRDTSSTGMLWKASHPWKVHCKEGILQERNTLSKTRTSTFFLIISVFVFFYVYFLSSLCCSDHAPVFQDSFSRPHCCHLCHFTHIRSHAMYPANLVFEPCIINTQS